MKIVFIGCVEIGFKCLQQIIKDKWDVVAIFTLAKKYAKLTSGFIDFSEINSQNKIPIYKVKDVKYILNINRIARLSPDLIVVCGWQRLIGKEILKIPKKGVIGFHSSLLPRYRGRAPVNWAIINGEKQTGVTMFYCESGIDSGDIIAQKSFSIKLNDTCKTVYDKSAKAACALLHRYLPEIEKGSVRRLENKSHRFPCWPKRNPGDGLIDWNMSALKVHNWIRALTSPYPGSFSYYNSEKYFILISRYDKRLKHVSRPPGEIIRIDNSGSGVKLLVATKDRPLWVWGITKDNGRPEVIFKVGEKFDG